MKTHLIIIIWYQRLQFNKHSFISRLLWRLNTNSICNLHNIEIGGRAWQLSQCAVEYCNIDAHGKWQLGPVTWLSYGCTYLYASITILRGCTIWPLDLGQMRQWQNHSLMLEGKLPMACSCDLLICFKRQAIFFLIKYWRDYIFPFPTACRWLRKSLIGRRMLKIYL